MDIYFIRDNPQLAKENQIKRFSDPNKIDEILKIDEEWRKFNFQINGLNKLKNQISKHFQKAPLIETVQLTDQSDPEQIDFAVLTKNQLKEMSQSITTKIEQINKQCQKKLEERDNLILTLGNFLYKDAPVDNNEDNNPIIYSKPVVPRDPNEKLHDHIDLGRMLGMVDTDNGIATSGNRGYFLTGMGVKLNLALIHYGLDFLDKKGYQLMSTPHLMNKEVIGKIAQLNEYEETLYKMEGEDKFLIATSEQPLTGYMYGKQFRKDELPRKYAGISNCFRKETGAHGKQTRGIFRVHEFQKVEQFCVTTPDKSWEMFHSMINTSREFYDTLDLDYRVISIVSGALNNAASMKFDLEAFFKGSNFYGELVSCTNCLDYFSKRIGTKIQETGEYAHMLNCTLFANTRTICCLMETHQTDKGMKIPQVLQKYIGTDFIPFK
ncbi:seryl-tRNA synthetase [Klosneuvirus KNV1]|uniref:serine--tRNA ligase n=1 Tax=Klosneuvirus KNV1 TaxID=1977640 RepID=A0A1V0SK42_9VIRU|nr:seryl-tRNA synthetase [Klosneuvirus KNV1]